ncbi:MAG TPA: sterol desaturase family protein [Polyangiaceae bacterium]|nr:sterol desaturase family protein [Polyangiaceae bacterium]
MSPLLILLAIPVFIGTFLGEAWIRRKKGLPFDSKDGASSVAMGAGFLLVNLALQGATLALFQFLYDHRLVSLGDGPWVWGLALVADDFVFYWAHRSSHEIRFLWATHEAHHSSTQYTLTTALRQPWTEPLGTFFWMPLPLLGFRPEMIIAAHTVSLIYQYWIHTELVGRVGVLEWVLNTPSHHRVHHGSNPRYIDKNHGGILIVWDRLFGTFELETEKPVYGLTKPLVKKDPLRASFNEWILLGKDLFRARTWRGRRNAVFGRTGTDYLACER